MNFSTLLPELYVSDMKETLRFYVDCLGFKVEYSRTGPEFAFVSYQGTSQLMLQELVAGEKEEEKLERPFGRGINFQIETENVQAIIDSLKKFNFPLQRGIKDSWYEGEGEAYGCREILVRDPDGYLLRFSQDLGTRKMDLKN